MQSANGEFPNIYHISVQKLLTLGQYVTFDITYRKAHLEIEVFVVASTPGNQSVYGK